MKNQPLLIFKSVSREFKQGGEVIHALQKTSLSISKGELVAIIGPSGSGKSTFLSLAGGLQSPTSGEIFVNNINITKLASKQLSQVRLQEIGFILQDSNLVPYLTIDQQLQLMDRILKWSDTKAKRQKIFKSLGIEKLTSKYPNEISGGERQRAAIAKVLYGSSSLILADEPTANLDTKRAIEVVQLLARETRDRKKATIMVTHDERLVEYCDKVFEMHDGQIKPRKQTIKQS